MKTGLGRCINYKFLESFAACEVASLTMFYLFFISQCLTWLQRVYVQTREGEAVTTAGEISDARFGCTSQQAFAPSADSDWDTAIVASPGRKCQELVHYNRFCTHSIPPHPVRHHQPSSVLQRCFLSAVKKQHTSRVLLTFSKIA